MEGKKGRIDLEMLHTENMMGRAGMMLYAFKSPIYQKQTWWNCQITYLDMNGSTSLHHVQINAQE